MAIASALGENRSITHLDLSFMKKQRIEPSYDDSYIYIITDNKIKEEGSEKIACALKKNESIIKLNLYDKTILIVLLIILIFKCT